MVQLQELNYEVRDGLLLDHQLKVGPLSKDDQRLQNNGQQRMNPFHYLVVISCHCSVTSLVLVLQYVVHTLQSSSFQLVNLVVQDLKAGNADHGHIVGGN